LVVPQWMMIVTSGISDEAYLRRLVEEFDELKRTIKNLRIDYSDIEDAFDMWIEVKEILNYVGKKSIEFVNRNYELSKSQNQKYFTKLTDELLISNSELINKLRKEDDEITFKVAIYFNYHEL